MGDEMMGYGIWDMGWELLPSLGLSSPEGASPIFNLLYPMLSSKEQKKGAFRVFICFLESRYWKLEPLKFAKFALKWIL
jgi:hypothetical protein